MGDSGVGDKLTAGLFANPDSGTPPVSASKSLEEQMKIYLQYLPQLQAANAQSQVGQAQSANPQYNALNFQQLQQYGMPTAQIQQQIANSNAMAGAQTNNQLLTGAGGQAGVNALALNKLLNPNYYNTADNISRQTNNMLNAVNLKGLSGGEQAAVERSLNQSNFATGNLGLDNATNAVKNASTFGGAFNSKIGILGGALNNANQSANTLASNGGVNPVGIALGTGQTNNSNVSSFTNPNLSSQSADISQSLLGGVNKSANQQNDLMNQFNKYSSEQNKLDSWTQGVGSICCFIFLECHNGVLPWYVRVERDKYYEEQPMLTIGYKKMAKWLVPLMKQFSPVKILVNWLMVKPITYYGGWKHKQNKTGWLFNPVRAFWFAVWNKTSN